MEEPNSITAEGLQCIIAHINKKSANQPDAPTLTLNTAIALLNEWGPRLGIRFDAKATSGDCGYNTAIEVFINFLQENASDCTDAASYSKKFNRRIWATDHKPEYYPGIDALDISDDT